MLPITRVCPMFICNGGRIVKKNILAVLSVICLLFAACSDEAVDDNTSSAAGEQSRVESADQNQSSITESPSGGSSEVEKIFLSDNILYWAIPDLCDISVENLNSLNRYLADNNYDFNLDFVSLPFDSYFSELENYSGELDIAFTGFNTDTNAVCSLMRNGYFAEMDSLLEGSQLYELYSEKQWQSMAVDGTIYSIPNLCAGVFGYSYVFNNDYIDKEAAENFDMKFSSLDDLMGEPSGRDNFSDIIYLIDSFAFSHLNGDYYENGLIYSEESRSIIPVFNDEPTLDFLQRLMIIITRVI